MTTPTVAETLWLGWAPVLGACDRCASSRGRPTASPWSGCWSCWPTCGAATRLSLPRRKSGRRRCGRPTTPAANAGCDDGMTLGRFPHDAPGPFDAAAPPGSLRRGRGGALLSPPSAEKLTCSASRTWSRSIPTWPAAAGAGDDGRPPGRPLPGKRPRETHAAKVARAGGRIDSHGWNARTAVGVAGGKN